MVKVAREIEDIKIRVNKIAGMVHYMLPDSTRIINNQNIAKFGDTGIAETVRRMEELGAKRQFMVAKIAGGAKMFAIRAESNLSNLNVGDNNIESAKIHLAALGIKLIAEDTGLNYGRTIEFFAEDGSLKIKSVGREPKFI